MVQINNKKDFIHEIHHVKTLMTFCEIDWYNKEMTEASNRRIKHMIERTVKLLDIAEQYLPDNLD